MKIEELYEGRIFKNYKELCKVLRVHVRTGNSKIRHIREIERFCSMEREGHSIIINKIYQNPLPEIKGRGSEPTITTPLRIALPRLAREWLSDRNGVLPDKVTRTTKENFWWKCSECKNVIYSSMRKRIRGDGEINDSSIRCLYCSLSIGAKKIADILIERDIKFTTEQTFQGLIGINKGLLRYDFSILSENDEVEFLIEYDGEFHFYEIGEPTLEKSKKRLEIQHEHDKRKNEYCKDNTISLTRIYFFDDESVIHRKIEEAIFNFSNNIHCVNPAPYEVEPTNLFLLNRIKEIEDEVIRYENRIESWKREILALQEERDEIVKEIKFLQ